VFHALMKKVADVDPARRKTAIIAN
jgi:hypothetical protein